MPTSRPAYRCAVCDSDGMIWSHHLDDVEFWVRCSCVEDPVIVEGMAAVRQLAGMADTARGAPGLLEAVALLQLSHLKRLARTQWVDDEKHRAELIGELTEYLTGSLDSATDLAHYTRLARFLDYLPTLPLRVRLGG
jgi:hypothetical protein